MNLNTYIKKLRAAADSLEELFYAGPPTAALSARIAEDVNGHSNGHAPTRKAPTRVGLHWTQKPENKAKVAKIVRKAAKSHGSRALPKKGRPAAHLKKPAGAKPGWSTVAVRKNRTRTAAILSRFSTTEPQPFPHSVAGMGGVLVRRGYIKRMGEGYVRTDKPFYVNPNTRDNEGADA